MYAQMPALSIGAFASATVITTTFWNQWAVSGPTSSGVLGPIWAWRSLFGTCMQYQGGQSQCQGQNSMFLMPGYILAIRGLMIAAVICSILATFGILLGSECTRILEKRRGTKRRIMFLCGVGHLVAGCCTLISVVWYTVVLYGNFFKVETQDNMIQWELGACVYLGYVGTFICIAAAVACALRPGPRSENDTDDKITNYYYKPRAYEFASSRDDEQTKGLLQRYKSKHSSSSLKSPRRPSSKSCVSVSWSDDSTSDKPPSYSKRSSKDSPRRHSTLKSSSRSFFKRRDSGHNNPPSRGSFSSVGSSISQRGGDNKRPSVASSVDTYKFNAYI